MSPSTTAISPPSHQPSTTNPPAPSRPLVGVALFLFSPSRPSKFLLGKRLNSHGSGTWALPGGHLEFSESFEECAARELVEETGLRVDLEDVGAMRFLTATNDVFPAEARSEEEGREGREVRGGKHYITIFMVARLSEVDEREGREARVMEPEKCEGWEWVGWEELVGLARAEGEMEERKTKRVGGGEGDGEERREKEGQETKRDGVRRLFLPLINLIKQRPDVVPRFD